MQQPTLFVFAVTDQALGNEILDLITGKTQAALTALTAQSDALVKQAQGISTAPPPPPPKAA